MQELFWTLNHLIAPYRRRRIPSCCALARNFQRRVVAISTDDSFLAWSSEATVVTLVNRKSLDRNDTTWDSFSLYPMAFYFDTACLSSDQRCYYRLRKINCPSQVTALCFGNSSLSQYTSPLGFGHGVRLKDPTNALLLAVGLKHGSIRIYLPETGKLLVELLDHRYAIEKLAFSPRNSVWHSLLLSCSGDSTLKLWDLYDGGNMYRTLKDHLSGEHVLCCAWSSNGRWAASGGTDHRLIVWRTNCWCSPHSSYRLGSCVIDCDFSPDSALLVSCSCDSMAIVFDHVNNYPLVTLPHEFPVPLTCYQRAITHHKVIGLSFSSDGEHIVTICTDNKLRVWNLSSPLFPCTRAPMRDPTSVCYFKNGKSVAVCSADGILEIRSTPTSVQRLSAICRKVLRSTFSWETLQQCLLPKELHLYLGYKELLQFRDC